MKTVVLITLIWLSWTQQSGLYVQTTPYAVGTMLTVCAPSDAGRTLELSYTPPGGMVRMLGPWWVDMPHPGKTPCYSWQLPGVQGSGVVRRLGTRILFPQMKVRHR